MFLRTLTFHLIISLLLLSSATADDQINEQSLKAIYFKKFAEFIEWPANSSDNRFQNDFVIGIFGKDEFISILTETFKNEKIKGKNVKIKKISHLKNINECSILYIPESQSSVLSYILKYTGNKPILTISDTKNFCQRGVIINIYLEKNQLLFEINETTMKKSGLYISYHLMRLARIVNPVGEGK